MVITNNFKKIAVFLSLFLNLLALGNVHCTRALCHAIRLCTFVLRLTCNDERPQTAKESIGVGKSNALHKFIR